MNSFAVFDFGRPTRGSEFRTLKTMVTNKEKRDAPGKGHYCDYKYDRNTTFRVFARTRQRFMFSGNTRDGKHGDHVLLAPPFIMTEQQIPEIVEPLQAAIIQVLEERIL